MPNFINDFLEHTKLRESPGSFWRWSAYVTIASVLRDNCYRRQGDSYLYPNIYVLLLADSSGHRKGAPIDMCEMFVHSVNNTKVIGGSTSIQALVDELSHTETDRSTGKLKKAGAGIFIAQEFSAALVEDPRAIKILTDIYDYRPMGYAVRLISRASSKIEKLTLSLFAGSNEAMLKGFFEDTAVYGGMLARTFLILPNEVRPSNSLWETPETLEIRKKSYNNVLNSLKQVAALSGEFQFMEDAKQEYDSWYFPFREVSLSKKDRSGISGRIHTHVLKIAMILAANDLTLCVQKHHMEGAIEVCMALLPNYNVFVMAHSGSSNIREAGTIVLQELLASPENRLARKRLIQNHWQDFDGELLDKVVATMSSGGLLIEIVEKGETSYQLTAKCLEIMQGKGV